jgi:hypothetical protein
MVPFGSMPVRCRRFAAELTSGHQSMKWPIGFVNLRFRRHSSAFQSEPNGLLDRRIRSVHAIETKRFSR